MGRIRIKAVFVVSVVAACAIHAQTPQPPAFEVVSIKPLDGYRQRPAGSPSDPGRVSYSDVPLFFLIMKAFDVKRYQIDGPPWIDSQLYDVFAKIPDGASEEQVPAMLQTMLAERFGLKMHRESRSEPVYALVAGRNGPKLKRSDDAVAPSITRADGVRIPASMSFTTNGHMEFSHATMARFAQALSNFIGRPVLDMTELPGNFDIVLDVSMADLQGLQKSMGVASDAIPENSTSASIFAAMQSLGLKLESRKAPIEHIVIDEARRVPTEN
jgi:uncharacterized protein (TIGR03435 family)